jgi:hypothetical protein
MAATGAAKAKTVTLPRSATITIRKQRPSPNDLVEVEPGLGRIHFKNKDEREYRLRFQKNEADAGIDIVLPAHGTVSVAIKKEDQFHFSVIDIKGGESHPFVKGPDQDPFIGGPIRN